MDVIDGNLEACGDLDITIDNAVRLLDVSCNGDLEFIDRDTSYDSSADYYMETYIVNGKKTTVKKNIRKLTYEECESWDNFINGI